MAMQRRTRPVASFDDGLAMAKSSSYGLGATLLTADDAHASRGDELPAAVCWVNEWQGEHPVGSTNRPASASSAPSTR